VLGLELQWQGREQDIPSARRAGRPRGGRNAEARRAFITQRTRFKAQEAVNGSLKRGQRLVRSWVGALRRPFERPPQPGRAPQRAREEVTPSGVSRRDIERLVGMPIGDLGLYEHALRHRSVFRGTVTSGTESNERLEFLGD